MKENLRSFRLDTWGWMATALLLICMISGVLLAIPYDIKAPYYSLTKIVTADPFASFDRNIHYWSAQLFLVFSLIHIYDHLRNSSEDKINDRKTWFILTLSILAAGYVMISGFILKADADSLQAKRIIGSLLQGISYAGNVLQTTFLGKEGDFQLIYIHHIATATIILIIAIYDHVHTIWAKLRTILGMLIIVSVVSLFFQASLQTEDELVLKGPWYFVGIQEIIHYINHPVYLIVFVALVLVSFYLLPVLSRRYRKILKYCYLLLFAVYLVLTILGYYFRGENWQWQWPGNKAYKLKTAFVFKPVQFKNSNSRLFIVQGRIEGCLSCHSGIKGLSASHSPLQTGCFACHRGDPYTLNKKQAHRGMETVPGNLLNAAITCGSQGCHQGIVYRIENSMMARLTGMISVDKFAFGESNNPDSGCSLDNIDHSAADQHLKNLCAGCHLGNEKKFPGPAGWLERGGGCNACHLTYGKEAKLELEQNRGKKDVVLKYHPAIDLEITNDKCLSCHSRSGRISMNYEGWHETNYTESQVVNQKGYRTLPDKRVFKFVSSDVHHQKGMICIDCHGSYELMGDENHYKHKEDAVNIQCTDCHSHMIRNTAIFKEIDNESQLITGLRGMKLQEKTFLLTKKKNRPLVNAFLEKDGSRVLLTKLSARKLAMKPPSEICSEGKAHSRLSCEACHTAWVPQCIGCHNSYETKTEGWDMLIQKKTKGCWIEYAGKYYADQPVLGIRDKQVYTMMPGMILSIDKGSFSGNSGSVWKRLYAPASGHTTQKQGRSCKSCHNNPLAIGYGRGELRYSITDKNGSWSFESQFALNKNDGIPEDAWIPFLKERKGITGTRKNIRPFNLEEQHKILTVGSCLVCHAENSVEIHRSIMDYQTTLKKLSKKCILPSWTR